MRPLSASPVALALLLAPLACGPMKGVGDSDSDGTSSSSSSSSSTSSSSSSSSSSSTSSSTTATDTTTGDETTGLAECPWYWPENLDSDFCPPVALENASITGETPYGPLDLRYARFGLQECAWPCPEAYQGRLLLYATPTEDKPTSPDGDFLEFVRINDELPEVKDGRIGGETFDNQPVTLEITLPSMEETTPPLDENAPPLATGTLEILGDGWKVSGTFTAPLCTHLNWSYACE
ncbi:MAG: hypothetical protein KC486_22770 [Myxococcales bacterium]|nr:hypothetical protein [Myxococcales bacterium]